MKDIVRRFGFSFHANEGVFAQYISTPILIIIFCVLVACFIIVRMPRERIALGAIVLGAASTVIDRIRFGTMTDWLSISSFAFNGGDILIVVGIFSFSFSFFYFLYVR